MNESIDPAQGRGPGPLAKNLAQGRAPFSCFRLWCADVVVAAFCSSLALLAMLPRVVSAAELTLPASEDAFISEHFPAPTGTASELIIGTQGNNFPVDSDKNRGLLRFTGVNQIPAGARITSVRLTMTVTKAPPGPVSDFHVHRLLKPWNDSECSWLVRLAGPDGSWNEPGGEAGTDYAEVSSAHQMIAGPALYAFESTDAFIADVNLWLSQPTQNFGWLVKTVDESIGHTARRVAATGGIVAGPTLIISYDLESLQISGVQMQGNQICFQFPTKAGASYVVEKREALADGAWLAFTNVAASVAAGTALICDPATAGSQFYRVGEH